MNYRVSLHGRAPQTIVPKMGAGHNEGRSEKKASVIERLKSYFDKFSGIGSSDVAVYKPVEFEVDENQMAAEKEKGYE